MGIKNTVFFIDLNTLDKKIDDKLKAFLDSEELEEKDVVKIIYNEANRIGQKDKVKVTFQIIDGDSFRIIVENACVKYKGTIIYPYQKVKSDEFEFVLDAVCGKITLYNIKSECEKISVTIDNVAVDMFSMSYLKAKELLKNISDRKTKNGYIEFPDYICFKQYGIKLNAAKNESGSIDPNLSVSSIDIFNEDEFFKEYHFKEEAPERYDVNIPLPDEYNYEKKEKKYIVEEKSGIREKQEIEIEIPDEEIETQDEIEEKKKEEDRKRQEELEAIRKKQDEELERVKNKLKRELEEELNKSIKKYDEENEKRLNKNIETETKLSIEAPETIKEIVEEQVEDKQDIIDSKVEEMESVSVPIQDIREEIKLELKNKIENAPEIEVDIDSFETEENVKIESKEKTEENEVQEEIEQEVIEDVQEIEAEEVKEPILTQNQKEILELERLLEEEKKQQEALEKRIKAKLEELKVVAKEDSKIERKEVKTVNKAENNSKKIKIDEPIKVNEPDGVKSYFIESYVGIQEQGRNMPSVYFGQSKEKVRKYFGGAPKEIRDYEEMELYDIFYAYYDEEDKCTGIGIYNQEIYKDKIALYMFGQNLITMKYRDIVKLIKKNDYNAIEDDDGIISLKYGISVDPKESSNYKDEISDVIHIFKKGYYDEVYENF